MKGWRGRGSALLLRCVTGAAALAMTLALVRLLGPEQFGHWAAMLSLATFTATAAVLGQDVAILRLGGRAAQPEALAAGTGTTATAALVVTAALSVLAGLLALAGRSDAATISLGAAALTLPLAIAEVALATAQARGRLWLAFAPRDVLWRFGVTACALIGVAGQAFAGLTALTCAVAAGGFLFALVVWQMRRTGAASARALLTPRWRPGEAALGRMIAAISSVGASSLSVVVLAAAMDAPTAGAFFVAQRIAQIAALPLNAARAALAGPVAEAHAARDTQRLSAAAAQGRTATITATMALGFVLAATGNAVLQQLDVPDLGGATLQILLAGVVLNALTGPTGMVMMLCGGHRALTLQTAIAEGMALAAVPLASALAGPVGAALALTAGIAVKNVLAMWWCRRRLGIDPGLGAVLWPVRGKTPRDLATMRAEGSAVAQRAATPSTAPADRRPVRPSILPVRLFRRPTA